MSEKSVPNCWRKAAELDATFGSTNSLYIQSPHTLPRDNEIMTTDFGEHVCVCVCVHIIMSLKVYY